MTARRHNTLVTALAMALALALALAGSVAAAAPQAPAKASSFESEIAPILEQHCVECHNADDRKGDVILDRAPLALEDPAALIELISGPEPEMPKKGDPLSGAQVDALRRWVERGLPFPEGRVLKDRRTIDRNWWSLEPVRRPVPPELSKADEDWCRTPVDRFIIAKLREAGLTPSAEADRRTLIRRLYFDLTGLPPSPEETDAFVRDADPGAYEKLVDRLLASPRYGERWARHWLDVARYGESHGYDKDKPRPNAWRYRDYVIRAFNDDKPYAQFVREQVAGDALFPGTEDGIVATGFIAAGPWDFIAHHEVGEEKVDGRIAKHMDRDDMVSAVFNVFMSTTVQCAQCHHHKFDPVSMEDYYRLQAVFAAVDRAERPCAGLTTEQQALYDQLQGRMAALKKRQSEITTKIQRTLAAEASGIDRRIKEIEEKYGTTKEPEFGYHSGIERSPDVAKWVQIDLGEPKSFSQAILIGAHDDFNGIGAGFGFPARFKVEVSNDAAFREGVRLVRDETTNDFPNPGVESVPVDVGGAPARFIRITGTKLAPRRNDFILALAEVRVLDEEGENLAKGAAVTALDSIEQGARWGKANLVDGIFFRSAGNPGALAELQRLKECRAAMERDLRTPEVHAELAEIEAGMQALKPKIEALPRPPMVYAAATHFAQQGRFVPTNGVPRPIRVLHRGDIRSPGDEVKPGAPALWDGIAPEFALEEAHAEGDRRAALAEYLVDGHNPLTWRSIVNRVWLHHMGRGIVDSPNDFGRMGMQPTHPELLEWLAAEFRDGGQSFKELHRLIVTSAVYRQASAEDEAKAAVDGANRYYWRMARRKLEAEAVRDAVLAVSGKLRGEMFGPSFEDFVVEKPQHSPHYEYHLHDPDDPASHRRSIYRFIVRSQTQPFLTTLDCADPSQMVARRDETTTALQALALMNNPFVERMAGHFAERVEREAEGMHARVARAFTLALGREPAPEEREALAAYARAHGLANACRLIFNLSEFAYVD